MEETRGLWRMPKFLNGRETKACFRDPILEFSPVQQTTRCEFGRLFWRAGTRREAPGGRARTGWCAPTGVSETAATKRCLRRDGHDHRGRGRGAAAIADRVGEVDLTGVPSARRGIAQRAVVD